MDRIPRKLSGNRINYFKNTLAELWIEAKRVEIARKIVQGTKASHSWTNGEELILTQLNGKQSSRRIVETRNSDKLRTVSPDTTQKVEFA